jgi:imidazolonepropionase-like amidohydrolase
MQRLSTVVIIVFFQISLTCTNAQSQIVLFGGTLIDGTGNAQVKDAVVIIEGERISRVGTIETLKIPEGAHAVNIKGKFILPGLIDTHLHLEMVGLSDVGNLPKKYESPNEIRKLIITNARLDLMGGFTTVRDLGSTDIVFQIRDEINSNKLIGPTIIASGMQLVKKDPEVKPDNVFLEYDGVKDARDKVRYLKKLGAEVIKIRLTKTRIVPSLEEVEAIVNEAHSLGLKVTIHTDVPADDLVQLAVNGKADGIEHNAPLRSKDDSILSQMKNNGMSLMAGAGHFFIQRIDTTFMIDELDSPQVKFLAKEILDSLRSGIDSLHRQTNIMKQNGWNATQRQISFMNEMRHARKEGILLVFGTDCGASGMIHGEQYKALYGESQMSSTPMETILMATRDAAKAIGKDKDIGTIEVGKIADLLILNKNPLMDLRNIHALYYIIKSGIIYEPTNLDLIK